MSADKIHFLTEASFPDRILRLYHTLKPLRWEQYFYRAWYPLKKLFYKVPNIPEQALMAAQSWQQQSLFALPVFDVYNADDKQFSILNIDQQYPDKIDWNGTSHGMLWAYHLNYFGWLRDDRIPIATQLLLLKDYATDTTIKIGLDSYPTSLRSIAWVRFFIQKNVRDEALNRAIYQYCDRLYHFPEYHIQGNHLWENGCALTIAGRYFKDEKFYLKGKQIFLKALQEQVLPDGGHIEGSPMYHSLLLSGLMQCIEFLELDSDDNSFINTMRQKAAAMLGWLEQITFNNGNWPQVNDSTGEVAPSFAILKNFAGKLNIQSQKIPLKESGYRMLQMGKWELFIDVAQIQPVYQPGHAHADTFSFCLNANNKPFIVDPGISTYEVNELRKWQRSTDAHNTVHLGSKNSSDVWKSFRVGRRAKVLSINESGNFITASHDGYTSDKAIHSRSFKIFENYINIDDTIKSINNKAIVLNLHFHPDVHVEKNSDFDILAGDLRIKIIGAKCTLIEPYNYAIAFNRTVPANRLRIDALTPISITIENITC